ncbi:MAG: hypothetical protein SFU27_07595 [Thermonemataceae bacterium]|nr:hypothetical protein [Thermonemataceae bacterium]
MRNYFILFYLFFLSDIISAQELDKQEEKIWQDSLEKISLAEFKKIYLSYSKSIIELKKQKKENLYASNENLALNDEIVLLEAKLEEMKKNKPWYKAEETKENPTEETSNNTNVKTDTPLIELIPSQLSEEVVFKIQVGVFNDLQLVGSPQESSLSVEEDKKMRKFMIGAFSNFTDADKFKQCLQNIGVKAAWIVAYKNQQRVPLKDVVK